EAHTEAHTDQARDAETTTLETTSPITRKITGSGFGSSSLCGRVPLAYPPFVTCCPECYRGQGGGLNRGRPVYDSYVRWSKGDAGG
ncbi:hypothetical protein PanWU01x14_321080, partial [Parasponia andersonii]